MQRRDRRGADPIQFCSDRASASSLPIEIPLSEPYLLWRISSPLSRARPPPSFLLDVLARRVIVTWPGGRDGRGRHYLLPFQSLLEKNSDNAFLNIFNLAA